jgi:regulator of sigma E protease
MEVFGVIGGAATSLLGYLIPFLFVLTVVVFVHELGHFLVGRWCGVGVTAFSIGFGPELVGWNDRHGTRWKLSAIPLGGYVKFVGDVNGASVPDQEALARMSSAERAVSFPNQSLPKRAAIVAAGPIANFLLAIAVFAGMTYINGRQILTPRIEAIQPGSAAERAGFQPKDLVVSSTASRSAASPRCSGW